MNEYKWFYTNKNYISKINQEKLKKFYNSTFNYELGWEPLPNSKKKESLGNGKNGFLRFDKAARRSDPNINIKFSKYAIFGDSYALSRQVKKNETIAHYLGKMLNNYIPNYGVGNYGLDQAYLRCKKYKDSLNKKHIIYLVVPESIVRINTRWRHLHETGNIFGFKPKFSISFDNQLILEKNPISNFSDYECIFKAFKNNSSELINDTMYKLRFKDEAFNLENIISLNSSIFLKFFEYTEWLTRRNFLASISDPEGLTVRMKSNSKFTNKCYSNEETRGLLTRLILDINNFHKGNMSIFVLPQLSDLSIKNHKSIEYFEEIRDKYKINIFDATKFLINKLGTIKKAELIYVEKGYGGHLRNEGNLLIANWIKELI